MVDLWEADLRTARGLVKSANEYVALYSSQANKSESLKYITIIRAKVSSLKKAINNLEMCLVDLDSLEPNSHASLERRRDLDEVIYAFRSLELMLKNSNTDTQSPTQYNTRLSGNEVGHLTGPEFSYYRDAMIKIQDDELDLLDTSASAIKNISSNIRDEVNLHTRLLENVSTSMDVTGSFLNRNRERFNDIIMRSNKRQLGFIIVFLVLVLIILIVI